MPDGSPRARTEDQSATYGPIRGARASHMGTAMKKLITIILASLLSVTAFANPDDTKAAKDKATDVKKDTKDTATDAKKGAKDVNATPKEKADNKADADKSKADHAADAAKDKADHAADAAKKK